jgi:hypothetical protein
MSQMKMASTFNSETISGMAGIIGHIITASHSTQHTAPNQKRVTGYYITSMLLMDEDGLLVRSTPGGYRSIAFESRSE